MLAGRASVYDNEYYLSATHPSSLGTKTMHFTPSQRASMSIMHVFVQCPRLNCLVRYAIMHSEDAEVLAAAVTLTEYMWQIDIPAHVADLMQSAVTVFPASPTNDMQDILSETLSFDSVQSMILCTRYWMLQNVLCGLIDTLQRHFPAETSLSLLPESALVRQIDIDAGIRLAESLSWAESVSWTLPLVPLRLHTPLQISIGPWHRTIRDTTLLFGPDPRFDGEVDLQASIEFARALRMKTWLIEKCNRIHEQWDVNTVDEKSLCEALDSMAGEEIPDWLPTRVRFEAEDGDMVIKLDYEKPSGAYQESFNLAGLCFQKPWEIDNSTDGPSTNARMVEEESPGDGTSSALAPANFLFQTGRNLCSTSGWWPAADTPSPNTSGLSTRAEEDGTFGPCTVSSWWPQTPKSSVVLLDSTHKTSAFQPKADQMKGKRSVAFDNRKTNGCMSPAWISTSGSANTSPSFDGGGAAHT
jgi:hypothetical protein